MKIEACFLGVPRVIVNGKELQINQKKLMAFLLYILFHTQCTREELSSIFWCDLTDEGARQNLRNSLHRLKKLLNCDILCKKGHHLIALEQEVALSRDIDILLAEDGGVQLLGFKSFVFLDKLYLRDTPEFDKWISSMRIAYERIAVERIESCMRESFNAGEQTTEQYAKKLLEVSPCHEEACRLLLQWYGNKGMYREVVKTYNGFLTNLKEEFNLTPEGEMQNLYQSVLEMRDFHFQNRHGRIASPCHEQAKDKILEEYHKFTSERDYQHCIVQGGMGAGKSQVINLFLESIADEDHLLLQVKFEVTNADVPYYSIGKIMDFLSETYGVELAEPAYDNFETIKLYHMVSMEKVIRRLKGKKDKILLHLENIEAIDKRSMDILITHLLGKCRGEIMVVGEYCTNFSPNTTPLLLLELLENVQICRLAPLNRQTATSYLSQQLHGSGELAVDFKEIWQRTGGTLMLLADVLHNIKNRISPLYKLSDNTLKKLAVLLSSLRPDEQECLELLSIFENGVELGMLSAITHTNSVDLVSVIDRLQRREIVVEEVFESHLLAKLKPDMIRDSLYSKISSLRRKELHQSAARWHEQSYNSGEKDYFCLKELKYHFHQAACYYEQVYYSIIELWYQLDYWDEFFPTITSDPEVFNSFYISKSETYKEFDRLEEHMACLIDQLSPEQNCELNMIFHYLKGRTLIRDSRGKEGLTYIKKVIKSAKQLQRDDLLLSGYLEIVFYGIKTESEPLMREYITKTRGVKNFALFPGKVGILLRLEALCDIMVCEYANAEILLFQSIEILESPRLKSHSYINVAAAYDYLGLSYRLQKDYEQSEKYLKKAIDLCTEKNLKKGLDLLCGDLGYTLFLQGKYAEAKQYFQKSADFYRMFDNYWLRSVGKSCMAIISAHEGEHAKALEFYRRAEIYSQKDRTQQDLYNLRWAKQELEKACIL